MSLSAWIVSWDALLPFRAVQPLSAFIYTETPVCLEVASFYYSQIGLCWVEFHRSRGILVQVVSGERHLGAGG